MAKVVTPAPLTTTDIESWWALESATECTAAIGERLGLVTYADELEREFYYWNIVFCKEAEVSAAKVRCPPTPNHTHTRSPRS